MSFKFRLVNLDNIVDSTCESIKDFLKYYGVKKFDDNDIVALQSLARNLFIKNRSAFNVSYVVSRLDKEFDLVKVGSSIVVNIELKLTKLDIDQCMENYRLLKTYYPDYSVFCFNYIKDDNSIFLLNVDEVILEESSFVRLNDILSEIVDASKLEIDINISPIYSLENFSYETVLLSSWQKSSFVGVIGSDKKLNIITGRPGSGKSALGLYLYDYYKKNTKHSVNYLVPFMFKDIINSNLIKNFNINTVRNFLKNDESFRCDICIIDEAQRINSVEYKFLNHVVKEKIILIGDINQNIDDEAYFNILYEKRDDSIAHFNMNGNVRTDDTFDSFARKVLDIPKKGIKNKVIDKSKIEVVMYDELDSIDISKFVYIEPTKSKYWVDCSGECEHRKCNEIINKCVNSKNTHSVVSCEYNCVLLYLCDGFEMRNGEISCRKKVCYRTLKKHLYSIITRTVDKLLIVTDKIEIYNYLMKCLFEIGGV